VRYVSADNVWTDGWEWEDDWSGGGAQGKRLPRGLKLGATLYQLEPGDSIVYHFHHGWEELLIVLRGRPILRTPAGERLLAEGEVVHFLPGPDGAHGLRNDTDAIVRYVMASTLGMPEVTEYPDLGKITAQAETRSQTGERLWLIHEVEPGSSS
jgi:uncharacterized cupin superfamily protein